MTKTVLETALNEELTDHLGYGKHDPAGRDRGNIRNGTRSKTVLTDTTWRGDRQLDHWAWGNQDTSRPPGLGVDDR